MTNNALSNKLLEEAEIIVFIPRYKISRKVMIKEIPEDINMDEVKKIVKEENSNIVISNLYRLRRRNLLENLRTQQCVWKSEVRQNYHLEGGVGR